MNTLRLLTVNIVVRADLSHEVDLAAISHGRKAIEYEPEQFPAAMYTCEDPRCKIQIFQSGKVMILGLRKHSEIAAALRQVVALLDTSANVRTLHPRIVNRVVTGDLGIKIHPENFLRNIDGKDFEYNTETPRSLIYKDSTTGATILLSKYGKMTVVGAKAADQIVDTVARFLQKYLPQLAASSRGQNRQYRVDEIRIVEG